MKPFLKKLIHFELKGRPIIIVFTLIFILVGGVLGYYFSPQDWSPFRRIFAGVLGGFGSAMIIVTSRMVGAYSDTQD